MYFSKVMIKCGADYFVKDPEVSIIQMRSVTFRVEQQDINDVDRMNGVEGRFHAYAIPKMWRRRLSGWPNRNTWEEWADWRPDCFSPTGVRSLCNVAVSLAFEKKHGVWVYSTSGFPPRDSGDVHPIESLAPNKAACDEPGLAQ